MGHETEFHTDVLTSSCPLLGASEELANYYEVLDVHQGATRLELREAYLQLKSTYGLGSAAIYSIMSEEMAKEQLELVEEAYRVLSDVVERRAYDAKMGFDQDESPRSGILGYESVLDAEASSIDIGVERILRSRAQASDIDATLSRTTDASTVSSAFSAAPESSPTEPQIVRTTRSMLPIVRLKANQVGTESFRLAIQSLLESHSPGDGALYRKLREAAQVSEEEMQDRIKVTVAYIKAIETNDLEKLPQFVYVKGFLRSYFRYLGVPNAETLVAAFAERLQECQAFRKV